MMKGDERKSESSRETGKRRETGKAEKVTEKVKQNALGKNGRGKGRDPEMRMSLGGRDLHLELETQTSGIPERAKVCPLRHFFFFFG